VLAPAAAAQLAATRGAWSADLTARLGERMSFARRAAAADTLVYNDDALFCKSAAEAGGVAAVLLVRTTPAARARFLAAIHAALRWEEPSLTHDGGLGDAWTEPADYGLSAAFPRAAVSVVSVDCEHGELFAPGRAPAALIPAVAAFLLARQQ
jgi:hypothetical protein